MKNIEQWVPTKFIFKNNILRANRDKGQVHLSSRLSVNLIGMHYSAIIKEHFKGKLIDLGCGNVPFYEAYKDYISENICVDWAESVHSNLFIDSITDLNKKLEFEDNEFDTALLSDVLEHIRKPEQLLGEIFRILGPGGKLILNVPFLYWLHEEPHDFFRYTRFALHDLLSDAGFQHIEITAVGGSPEVMADIFAKNVYHIPLIGRCLCRFAQWSCLCFVKTGIGKRISLRTSQKFPLGYIAVAEK